MPKQHPLKGHNRFKLGTFSTNADGGLAMTTVPERWRARWSDTVTAAQIADRAGLEFLLPIARWRGFGGETHAREWSFETFTWAAGLAMATERIGIFATVHVPLVHPLYAAKTLASIDHISDGRAGLNIVCGWNPDEFAMFGVGLSDNAYAPGRRVASDPRPRLRVGRAVRFRRRVLQSEGRGQPAGQRAGAASGDDERRLRRAGARFRGAKLRFPVLHLHRHRGRPQHVADIRERSAKCRARGRASTPSATSSAARRRRRRSSYYEHYAVERADHGAVDNHMAKKKEFANSHDDPRLPEYRQRFAGGAGTYPLVGTPEQIVDMLAADQRRRLCRRRAELRELYLRAAVLLRPRAAPDAAGRAQAGIAMADTHSAVHPSGFKLAMRTLVGGVTIVAAQDANGSYVGLTATAVCSLSVDPPSLDRLRQQAGGPRRSAARQATISA